MGGFEEGKPTKLLFAKMLRPLRQKYSSLPKQQKQIVAAAGFLLGAALLIGILYMFVTDHDMLFVAAEVAHFIGIATLVYKLNQCKSCAGLSLKGQIVTVAFLGVRLYCSFVMEYDVHTFLDFVTLLSTLFVVYTMTMTKIRASYNEEADTMSYATVLVPCLLLSFIAKPTTTHPYVNRVLWAFCVYTEAVSVVPQLWLMRQLKVVERFTAFYVFMLGVARFLSCAHWALQILDGNSFLWSLRRWGIWPTMVLISEAVQTTVLADFCYLYVKNISQGQLMVRIPSGLV